MFWIHSPNDAPLGRNLVSPAKRHGLTYTPAVREARMSAVKTVSI